MKGIKIMNLTYFRPKIRGNAKKNNPVNIRFVAKTLDIRYLSFENDVEISEVATLISMIPNF